MAGALLEAVLTAGVPDNVGFILVGFGQPD